MRTTRTTTGRGEAAGATEAGEASGRYSPGPWRRLEAIGGGGQTLTIVDANGDEVASVRGWCGDPDYSQADADLVAAAPEMLAALRTAREALTGIRQDFIEAIGYDPHEDECSIWQETVEDMNRAIAVADKAITNAEGRI